jgi:endoglucanase
MRCPAGREPEKQMIKSILTLSALLGVSACALEPTSAIKLNQVGYLPDAPKVAFVVTAPDATRFNVRRLKDDGVVFRGTPSAAVRDSDSGDRVQALEFSKLQMPGVFYLEVPGTGRSWPFTVGLDVYRRPYYLAMRSFYGQRCGTLVDLGPEFPGYRYGPCHTNGAYHASSGKSGHAPSVQGWHDAGDYGRYVVNSGLSTGTLLWTWELFGSKVANIGLDLPESGNGTPDILHEIRWNLEWLLTMQDSDGGVWHKQTSERFAGTVMPQDDRMVSSVIGTGSEPFKSTCATADFAAVMAIAARLYPPFDPPFATTCLDAARRAWRWADQNPGVLFSNPDGVGTGAYGDRNCADERLWAAAELWRTTREESYHRYFIEQHAAFRSTLRPVGPPSWPNVAPLALWTYVLGDGPDADVVEAIRQDALRAAVQIVERHANNGYRHSMTSTDYIWGSNSVAANYGMQLLVANAMQPDPRFVDAALDNLHYLLGRNTFSLSFVTRVGSNPFRNPHHRPSEADANPGPWPGLLAGGPNARPQDPAMRELPKLPPAKMYVDVYASYASNEIAINWNAPLVFLLAGLLPGQPADPEKTDHHPPDNRRLGLGGRTASDRCAQSAMTVEADRSQRVPLIESGIRQNTFDTQRPKAQTSKTVCW